MNQEEEINIKLTTLDQQYKWTT